MDPAPGKTLTWETPELKAPYPQGCLRAVSSSGEFWIRKRPVGGWRLLTFDASGFTGGTNFPSLEAAQDAAEQVDRGSEMRPDSA